MVLLTCAVGCVPRQQLSASQQVTVVVDTQVGAEAPPRAAAPAPAGPPEVRVSPLVDWKRVEPRPVVAPAPILVQRTEADPEAIAGITFGVMAAVAVVLGSYVAIDDAFDSDWTLDDSTLSW